MGLFCRPSSILYANIPLFGPLRFFFNNFINLLRMSYIVFGHIHSAPFCPPGLVPHPTPIQCGVLILFLNPRSPINGIYSLSGMWLFPGYVRAIRNHTLRENWLSLSHQLSVSNISSARGGTSCPHHTHPPLCWDFSCLSLCRSCEYLPLLWIYVSW